MKKRVLSVLLAAVMVMSLAVGCGTKEGGESASGKSETKKVEDLVIGEMHYSVVEDGGWAQAMHEGILKACENLGIDTEKQLFTMEDISEEDTALVEATVETLVEKGVDVIFGCSAGYATIFADIDILQTILSLVTMIVEGFALI